MFKQLLSLSCLVTTSIFTMEQIPLKPWVQSATTIQVKTIKERFKIDINDNTTVLDVKNNLHDCEGIPVAQQLLFATGTKYWFFTNNSPALANSAFIKPLMNEYNTNVFALLLQLRQPTTH